jgi:hypothetical protein
MRLLNVDSRQLEEYTGDVPRYAILSHTWEDDEVIFQDLADPAHIHKAGYYKIDQACRLAKSQGLDHVWVDTCCIDKSSSAELSEAINSMFRWYHESVVCYAFLSDVPPDESKDLDGPYSAYRGSRWFTRGWTLQELLAPTNVGFYNAAWQYLGERNSMRALLAEVTAIPEACLGGYHPDSECALDLNVAQRMAWASSRETTRLEDMAYCLMGLFDVHMPLLYGEGDRAFVRLQREILTVHADESILAFDLDLDKASSREEPNFSAARGALARGPREFARWNTYQRLSFSLHPGQLWRPGAALQWTNRGLSMTLPLWRSRANRRHALAVLSCSVGHRVDRMLVIPLVAVGDSEPPTTYRHQKALPATVGSWPILQEAVLTTLFLQVGVRDGGDGGGPAPRPQLRDGAIVLAALPEGVRLNVVQQAEWDQVQVILPSEYVKLVFQTTMNPASIWLSVVQRDSPGPAGETFEYDLHAAHGFQGETTVHDRRSLSIRGVRYTAELRDQMYLGFKVAALYLTAEEDARPLGGGY